MVQGETAMRRDEFQEFPQVPEPVPPYKGNPCGPVPDAGTRPERHSERPDAFVSASSGPLAITPRLLNLKQAAVYLGVSFWSVRDYAIAGLIPTVTMPGLQPRDGDRARKTLRRVLIDRADLDAFIEHCKTRHSVGTVAESRPANIADFEAHRTAEPVRARATCAR